MTVRIAHVISTVDVVGGAERVMTALTDAGRERGFDQLVLNPFGQQDSELARFLSVPFRAKPSDAAGIAALWRWLRHELTEFDPHIVHVHLFHASVAVAAIPRARSRSVRVLSHHHGAALTFEGRVKPLLDRWAGRRFDRVVAVSDSVRDHLIRSYGYSPECITTIRNGWQGNPRARADHRPNRSLISVGNLRREKGHSTLLRAFAEIPDSNRYTLVLVGDGPMRGELEDLAAELGIRERVHFSGAVDDVWPVLAEADLLVLPSLYEALGTVVMEAMASGLPVVASRVGGVPELVEEGVTGLLVPPGDHSLLAAALGELLADPQRCRQMGKAAASVAQAWRTDRMVERYFSMYSGLLKNVAA